MKKILKCCISRSLQDPDVLLGAFSAANSASGIWGIPTDKLKRKLYLIWNSFCVVKGSYLHLIRHI